MNALAPANRLALQLCEGSACFEVAVARATVTTPTGSRFSSYRCPVCMDLMKKLHKARDPAWPKVLLDFDYLGPTA
jgi:hypothetical protein